MSFRKRFVLVAVGLVGTAWVVWFWWDWPSRNFDAPHWYNFLGTGVVVVGIVCCFAAAMSGMEKSKIASFAMVLNVILAVAGLPAAYFWTRGGSELVADLGPACRGEGVARAASADAPPPLKIVVLDDRGEGIDWTGEDAEWRMTEAQNAALVACVGHREKLIETCEYQNIRRPGLVSHAVRRFTDILTVRVVAARTGDQLRSFQLRDAPRACREKESSETDELHGAVTFEQLAKDLEVDATQAPVVPGVTRPDS